MIHLKVINPLLRHGGRGRLTTRRGLAQVQSSSSETYKIPTRNEAIMGMQIDNEYDVLVIGGGATGAGTALDAAKRGLRTICIEREDFASGTSSRSTKLIWGGSRYLVQAFVTLLSPKLITSPVSTVKRFLEDFKMVMNCHRERVFLLSKQPHLTKWLPIAVPMNKWLLWPPPFGFLPAVVGPLGLFPIFFKFYDALSGFSCPPSHVMSRNRALRKFPQLANNEVKYCPVFYEGLHDDARTNLAIAETAAREGATMVNYCEAVSFIKKRDLDPNTTEEPERIVGAMMKDNITGDTYEVRAKSVVFCGGPFTDELRAKEDGEYKKAVTGASGIHIVLPAYYAPAGIGLVDMNTSDGRFLFFLPWKGHVVVGTTDHKCDPTMRPVPDEAEITWLLHEASKYLSPELRLRRQDILSAWSGIRPLAMDPYGDESGGGGTAQASRDHVVALNPKTGAIFVSGGKWTTYREMAEDAVDKVISSNEELKKRRLGSCTTLNTPLVGLEGYSRNLEIRLIQEYECSRPIAHRLARAYGGRAHDVLHIAIQELGGPKSDSRSTMTDCQMNENDMLLVPSAPILEAEVVFAARFDWAQKPADVLARRTRMAFLDKDSAVAAVPRVVELMGDELGWDQERRDKEYMECMEYLRHFGGPTPIIHPSKKQVRLATITDLKNVYRKCKKANAHGLGQVELKLACEMLNYPLSSEELHDCMNFAAGLDGGREGQVTYEAFEKWWNSDRLNAELAKFKESKTANLENIVGTGTMFG